MLVIGRLRALTVTVNEWMKGNTATACGRPGLLVLSFPVVIALWPLDPKDR
ncbi:hypothetical protein [Streptomyces sp. NPDC001546]|uniref:hypothetical protein n=1 Tax=Streptomyces sp. NPDC001546 TaxID=3364585 RepID=UPI0036B170D3